MVDVETERKAPAPGLKEKDEEENSGIGTEEERWLEAVCLQQAAVPRVREPLWALPAGRAPSAPEGDLGEPQAEVRCPRTQSLQKGEGTALTRVPREGRREGEEGACVS